MKTYAFILLFLLSAAGVVIAQGNNDIVSFRQVPADLHIQIGFLFTYILLGLLFLLLFIFYPRQRLNIYFSLYNISLAVMIIIQQIFKTSSYGAMATVAEGLVSRMIGMNILLFILYAIDRIKPIYWWFVGFTLCIDFPLSLLLKGRYAFFNEFVHATFTVICFFEALAAFKNKSAGSRLIGLIALAVVLININSVLYILGKPGIVPAPVLGIMSFAITICAVIYLALRYARTNTSLEQQLLQVHRLSEENLKKEQERQQLLAAQNETLEQQVTERTLALNKSLDELRTTQAQLIQSEKMASLGELTAGIAHEIQNPLNFVNNFSEVNNELIQELKTEKSKIKSDRDDKLEDEILNDIARNMEKINHHGKRADLIVKGMLEHSRIRAGHQEPTDINALADEYLRLSYQGLRAKDKSFNVTLKTDFDASIEKINIIPQDIGRVLLNLYNNAFYAASPPSKGGISESDSSKTPTIWVSTKKVDDKVLISVRDNGPGIPSNIVDKIFQPFFTTKPTGQGTGLGLSLSYDIIKAHGGEIKVESIAGEGSSFIIQIPFN